MRQLGSKSETSILEYNYGIILFFTEITVNITRILYTKSNNRNYVFLYHGLKN